eukprot:19861-Heterococcus_DN1.PRE.1
MLSQHNFSARLCVGGSHSHAVLSACNLSCVRELAQYSGDRTQHVISSYALIQNIRACATAKPLCIIPRRNHVPPLPLCIVTLANRCENCGWTLFPARNRHDKHFVDVKDFKCIECGAPKDQFVDIHDLSDPRNIDKSKAELDKIDAARAAAAAAGVPYEPPEPVKSFRSSSAELKALKEKKLDSYRCVRGLVSKLRRLLAMLDMRLCVQAKKAAAAAAAAATAADTIKEPPVAPAAEPKEDTVVSKAEPVVADTTTTTTTPTAESDSGITSTTPGPITEVPPQISTAKATDTSSSSSSSDAADDDIDLLD